MNTHIYFLQVCKYKRLTELEIENRALQSLDNVQPGDCIVCFSKNDVYTVSIFCVVLYAAYYLISPQY